MRLPKTPAVIATAVIVGWWAFSVTRPSSETRAVARNPQNIQNAGRETSTPAIQAKVKESKALASVITKVEQKKTLVPFEFQKELDEYAALKTKVLPSGDEQRSRDRLLKDARFLRSLGARLSKIPMLPLGEQDAALDVLVDALKNGDKAAAEQAISEIVEDRQVEDVKIPGEQREQLAGVKAEVLYHWTAIDSGQAAQVAKLLPGPVSRKIWSNVQEAQQNNLAESTLEAGR